MSFFFFYFFICVAICSIRKIYHHDMVMTLQEHTVNRTFKLCARTFYFFFSLAFCFEALNGTSSSDDYTGACLQEEKKKFPTCRPLKYFAILRIHEPGFFITSPNNETNTLISFIGSALAFTLLNCIHCILYCEEYKKKIYKVF